ncbi:segregation/condensation protein A [Patescibacteria group bacterium]|nr:segregation/condensation protein A [Patescibacteria group bacterium]
METDAAFKVKHETFEGPIEVLLELIEKRKLFVNDVSLASVTEDFIDYMRTRGMHPDETANFLAVAATLILIKARSLLPNISLTLEETESITDLERRVALLQIISHVAGDLAKQYGKKLSFEGVRRMTGVVFAPDPKLHLEDLTGFIGDAVKRAPVEAPKKPEARVFKTISISEVLSTLTERIEHALQHVASAVSFNSVRVQSPDADERSQKVYTIVSFLGMLELVRRGFLAAEQHELFSDISLEKQSEKPLPTSEPLTEETL